MHPAVDWDVGAVDPYCPHGFGKDFPPPDQRKAFPAVASKVVEVRQGWSDRADPPLEDTPHDLGLQKSAGDEPPTARLPMALASASVIDASTKGLDALERLAAFSAPPKPGEEMLRSSCAPLRMCPTPATKGGTLLEFGQDPGALIQGDNADTCGDRLAVLISTELPCMGDERREGWSSQDSADGDVAP